VKLRHTGESQYPARAGGAKEKLDPGFRRGDALKNGVRVNDTSHLKPGTALPRIALPATAGGEVCLAEIPGRSVLIVYPWTGRPGHPNPPNWDDIEGAHGSTTELEGFRDLSSEFAALHVALFGLSTQAPDWQREMAMRLRLPFPILSDAEGRLARALALPSFATGGESYLKRLTLILASGAIEHLLHPVPDPAAHAGEVLRWFRKVDRT
jgi:peroxiredoxin